MKTLSNLRRHCTAGLLAIAIVALLGLLAPGAAHAQDSCITCRGNQTYKLTIGTWPVGLGFISPTVYVENQGTAVVTSYVHSNLSAGSVVNQTFSTSFPTQQFKVIQVGFTFCSGHVLLPASCSNYDFCLPNLCNGKYYCIKLHFGPGTGGACQDIRISAIEVPAPGGCPSDFCSED